MTSASTRARRLRIAHAINIVIVVAQVVIGFGSHSIGLLADAGHNLTDVLGLALAFAAVQLARRPATAHRSYGWHRGPILAAQANAAMILALTVWILVEGGRRLADPPTVCQVCRCPWRPSMASAANAGATWVVHEGPLDHPREPRAHRPRSHAPRSRPCTTSTCTARCCTSSATRSPRSRRDCRTLILVLDGWYWLDPAMSILIGLSIGRHAWRLLRSSNAILLEGVPEGLDPEALHADMARVPGVATVHDLHVWPSAPGSPRSPRTSWSRTAARCPRSR